MDTSLLVFGIAIGFLIGVVVSAAIVLATDAR